MAEQIHRLRCACGWETTGSIDELIEQTTEHGRRVHNMSPTRDEVLAMIVPPDEDEPEAVRA